MEKQHATGICSRREPALERLVCRGCRDGCLRPRSVSFQWLRISQMSLPEEARVALVVLTMALGFSGVLVSTLLNLPDTLRRTALVLFAAALLCFRVRLHFGLVAVSGASSRWF